MTHKLTTSELDKLNKVLLMPEYPGKWILRSIIEEGTYFVFEEDFVADAFSYYKETL